MKGASFHRVAGRLVTSRNIVTSDPDRDVPEVISGHEGLQQLFGNGLIAINPRGAGVYSRTRGAGEG